MGDLSVMSLGDWESEKIQRLPRQQEVLAVVVCAEVVPVGEVGDQDLELTFEVIRGPSKGRRIMQHIPLWDRAGHLGITSRSILNMLCRALGIVMPSDSSAFVGKALTLRLTRHRGSQEKPHVLHLPCSESDREALERRSKRTARVRDEKAQQDREESEGDQ